MQIDATLASAAHGENIKTQPGASIASGLAIFLVSVLPSRCGTLNLPLAHDAPLPPARCGVAMCERVTGTASRQGRVALMHGGGSASGQCVHDDAMFACADTAYRHEWGVECGAWPSKRAAARLAGLL